MINAIIISGEEWSQNEFPKLIQKHIPEITHFEVFAFPNQCIPPIQEIPIDLLFFEVALLFQNGYDVLKLIRNHYQPDVIIMASDNQYAIEAIRLNVFDYLLKPINLKELKQAVKRHIHQRNQKQQAMSNRKWLQDYQLKIATSEDIKYVSVSKIISYKADRNYTLFNLANGKKFIRPNTLKGYEDVPKSHHFFRSHKSHLVNLKYVKSYSFKQLFDNILGSRSLDSQLVMNCGFIFIQLWSM